MKRHEFYKAVVEGTLESMVTLRAYNKQIADLKSRIESGKYTQQYINEMKDQIRTLERKAENERYDRVAKVEKLVGELTRSLEDEVALRGSDITDDAKLLNFPLNERELSALLTRNKGNPTMEQLILKNATERGIDLGVHFIGNRYEIQAVQDTAFVVKTVLKYPERERVFDECLGSGSAFEQNFNVLTAPKAPSISYSDDRVANMVRLLSDNRISPEVQKNMVREFADRPAILPLLKDAAEKGGNLDAVEMATDLLMGKSVGSATE